MAMYSKKERIFFTTLFRKTVEVVNADGSERNKLFEGTHLHRLLGISLDTRQR